MKGDNGWVGIRENIEFWMDGKEKWDWLWRYRIYWIIFFDLCWNLGNNFDLFLSCTHWIPIFKHILTSLDPSPSYFLPPQCPSDPSSLIVISFRNSSILELTCLSWFYPTGLFSHAFYSCSFFNPNTVNFVSWNSLFTFSWRLWSLSYVNSCWKD